MITVKMPKRAKIEKKYPPIVKKLKNKINSGLLTGTLPGVKQLAKEFDVNFMTVNKAIKKLEEEGLVFRIPRKGTYVKRMRNIAFCFNYDNNENNYIIDSVYSTMFLGAQRYLSQHSCPMFLESGMLIGTPAMTILKNRVDGLIFHYPSDDLSLIKDFETIPAVRVLSVPDANCCFDHVTYDNNQVGALAAKWLLKNGHHNVAYVGDQSGTNFGKRLSTFIDTIHTAGGKVHFATYDLDTWEPRSKNIKLQMDTIMNSSERPSAIFCPSDNEIGMIYDNLYKYNLEPMKDVTVISCNYDVRILGCCDPAPVSVDICMEQIGELAAQRLLERINDPKLPKRVDVLQPVIIDRNKRCDCNA